MTSLVGKNPLSLFARHSLSYLFSLVSITLLFAALPSRSSAEENTNPVSAPKIFRLGTVAIRLTPLSYDFSSILANVAGSTDNGVHHNIFHYSDDGYYEGEPDESYTYSRIGLGAGVFMAPQFLFEFEFNFFLFRMRPICFDYCESNDYHVYHAYEFGGGFSYFQPISNRTFLDLGFGMQTTVYEGGGSSDSRAAVSLHSAAGYFLTKELALSFGFYYDHYFENNGPDVLGLRTKFSLFFPLNLFASSSSPRPVNNNDENFDGS